MPNKVEAIELLFSFVGFYLEVLETNQYSQATANGTVGLNR